MNPFKKFESRSMNSSQMKAVAAGWPGEYCPTAGTLVSCTYGWGFNCGWGIIPGLFPIYAIKYIEKCTPRGDMAGCHCTYYHKCRYGSC